MKKSKKMILVPEDEYLTLLSMIKGENTLGYEKAKLEREMNKTLKLPINAEIKSKKYDRLYKQKKNMMELIENSPQKVIVDDISAFVPSVPPYVDVQPIKRELSHDKTGNLIEQDQKIFSSKALDSNNSKDSTLLYESPPLSSQQANKSIVEKEQAESDIEDQYDDEIQPYINSKFADKLKEYLKANKKIFGIGTNNAVKASNQGRSIQGSDFETIVRFMTDPSLRAAKAYKEPLGFRVLFQKLKKDPYFKKLEASSRQRGEGKQIKPIKRTKGLTRIRKFKPTIWARL